MLGLGIEQSFLRNCFFKAPILILSPVSTSQWKRLFNKIYAMKREKRSIKMIYESQTVLILLLLLLNFCSFFFCLSLFSSFVRIFLKKIPNTRKEIVVLSSEIHKGYVVYVYTQLKKIYIHLCFIIIRFDFS